MPLEVGVNSYVSTEDAAAYFEGRLHAGAWGSATEQDRAAALMMATRVIDRQRLSGNRADPEQVLEFPRRYVERVWPWTQAAPPPTVPQAIKDACCEEALALLTRGNSQRRMLQQEGVIGVRVGNASETYAAGQTGKRVRPDALVSQEARELLGRYLLTSVEVV